jgi:hypothetical protein
LTFYEIDVHLPGRVQITRLAAQEARVAFHQACECGVGAKRYVVVAMHSHPEKEEKKLQPTIVGWSL